MKRTFQYIGLLLTVLFISNITVAQNVPDDNATAPSGSVTTITLPNGYNQGGNTIPANYNYTRAWFPVIPMTDSTGFSLSTGYTFAGSTVRVKTDYQNGWGQTLLSLSHRSDFVHDMATVYDNRAVRSKLAFLSYPTSTQNSHFQVSPYADQQSFYQNLYPGEGGTSYSLMEQASASGIQSVTSYSPGKSFVGQGRGTTVSSGLNTVSEGIRIWTINAAGLAISNGIYGDNTLIKTITTGQHSAQSVAYTNKDGELVCKKVQSDANTWQYTYYVYNDFGKICYILTPKAVTALVANGWQMTNNIQTGLCFSYVYDNYGQIVQRSIPGKNGVELNVYDRKHRPVLYQNPLLLQAGKWRFTIYDKQGRTIMTGLVSSTNTQAGWTNDIANTAVPTAGTLLSYFINEFSGTYPTSSTAIPNSEIHEFYYYDTYDQDAALSGRTFDNSRSTEYLSGPEYVIPQVSNNTYGMLTGRKVFIPGASGNMPLQWINSVFFYDQFGRIIQTQVLNPFNGNNQWDVSTTQYSFEGKTVLTIDDHHAWASANKTATIIYKKYVYDLTTGRLKEVRQKTDNDPTWRYISQQGYDVLGRVNDKKLGGVEHQVFAYNIRGQLTDMNKDFINYPLSSQTQDMTFGLSLSYDYGFTDKRYDGTISGFLWKGSGHSPRRAYGYSYDQAGRMVKANYNDFTLASSNPFQNVWNNENTDYSVSNITYDANGNMLTMKQRGVATNGPAIPQPVDIDNLSYTYLPNSNTLDKVEDAVGTNYHLEDFLNNNAGSSDYTYDADGNLKSDANKGITNITYNYLDLPLTVTTNTGTITNIYDATGMLLQKTITTPTSVKLNRYWGAFNYENDELKFVLHDEGRCRWLADSSKFKYDFFAKDHLGNVRTTVTADYGGTKDYLATYEMSAANTENLIFEGIEGSRAPKPGSTSTSDVKAALLNGEFEEKRIGTSLLLRVMAGDKFNTSAYHFYDQQGDNNVSASTQDMMSSIINTLAGGTTPIGNETGGNPVDKLFTPENYAGVYDAIKENATDPSLPRAYLNYVVFDENMRIVPEQSGALQVSAVSGSWQQIALPNEITVGQNGYLAVYISNEQYKNVFFDYLDITYYRGRLLEEQHYYPHGLTIRSGSSTPVPNKFLYQGKLLQDELGLELYDFHARQYDPQIGRFWGIDPLDQFPSGYTGMANDPANNIDPTGMASGNYAQLYGTYGHEGRGVIDHEDWQTNLESWNVWDAAQVAWYTMDPGETTGGAGAGVEADPTTYYTSNGQKVKEIQDGSNNVVIFDQENDAKGVGLLNNMDKILSMGVSLPKFSDLLHGLGLEYDIAAFSKFFVDHGTETFANKIDETSISRVYDIKLDGKPFKPYAEVIGNLVVRNNFVTTGKNTHTDYNMTQSYSQYVKPEIGLTQSYIHTHPVAYSALLQYHDLFGITYLTFRPGPSGDGMSSGDYHAADDTRYRNVVVDSKFIYLYNSKPSQTIIIPR